MGRRAELRRLAALLERHRLVTLTGPPGAGKTRLALEFADSRGEESLLLLDNCDHGMATRLLATRPGVRIVATSTQPLGVPDEGVLPVGPMGADTVRLFRERARDRAPEFNIDATNTDIVTELCGRLDGLPLAVERAAWWVRLLPVEQILDRVRRHPDMFGTWHLPALSAGEQLVMRRLSVMSGGFDADGAAAVCGLSVDEVTAVLARLADNSVIIETVPGRYRQADAVRQRELAELRDAGELDEVRARMVAWLGGLADRLTDRLFADSAHITELDRELVNLEAAVLVRDDRWHAVLVAALARCWREHGRPAQARTLLADTLATGAMSPDERAIVAVQAAWAAIALGDYDEAIEWTTGAVESARRPVTLARALSTLGWAAQSAGRAAEAVAWYGECVDVARTLGRPVDLARCLQNLAWSTFDAGDGDTAAELLDEALALLHAHGEPAARSHALHSAGTIALARGQFADAEKWFVSCIEVDPTSTQQVPSGLEGLAVVAAAAGRCERALRLAAAATAARAASPRSVPEPSWRRRVEVAIEGARREIGTRWAVRATVTGRRLCMADAVVYALHDRLPVSGLSERELEVTELVAHGLTSQQIAGRLRISLRTAESHQEHIRHKLGLRSRAEIEAWWTGDS